MGDLVIDAPSNPVSASSFQNGTDGKPRLAWARYDGVGFGRFGYSYGAQVSPAGHVAHRSRTDAARVTLDLLLSNPTIATLIESLTTHCVGPGLKFSSKIDAERLGLSPEEGQALASQIEREFSAWSDNPIECDLTGRHTLSALATAAFKSWLVTGEIVAAVSWLKASGARTKTKIALLDPRQLDQSKTSTADQYNAFQGVAFDKAGRLAGFYIRPMPTGGMNVAAQAEFRPSHTPWGRPLIVHVFDFILPGQVRGLSPLAAALTPAHERNSLGEFTLSAALLQTQYALTVESDLPPAAALGGLAVDHSLSGGTPDMLGLREQWYSAAKIQAQPGVINHLAPGDKLKINRSETPNSTFDSFDKSLSRQAARAAGSSYEDASGDYSSTSFSASRMASELPHRLTLRRRKAILEEFYRPILAAWLEEAIATGVVSLPRNAKPFWQCREAYCAGSWLGMGRVSPDPKRSAEATILELESNLTTLRDALAERGLDLEETIKQRAAEKKMLEAAGLSTANVLRGSRQDNSAASNQGRGDQ